MVLTWKAKVIAAVDAAVADAEETNWKHKVTPDQDDLISDMRLRQKAAKILRQNIFSAAQEFDDSFTQDSKECLTLSIMPKMQRRLLKHSMKNSLRNEYHLPLNDFIMQ